MIRAELFAAFLLLAALYAVLAGGAAERRVAALLIAAWFATLYIRRPFVVRFTSVEIGVLLVDAMLLVGLVIVAATSTRRWPTWAAALQFVSLAGHFAATAIPGGNWRGYQTLLATMSWLIVVLLVGGTALRPERKIDASWPTSFGRWAATRRKRSPGD